MIRVFPLIFLSLFFFLLIANVENLTPYFNKNDELIELNSMITENENVKSIDEIQSQNNTNQLLLNHQNNEIVNKEKVKKDIFKPKEKLNDNLASLVELENNDTKFDIKSSNNYKYNLQFGAFSQRQNAIEHSKKIKGFLQQNFPNVIIEIIFDKKKDFYKVLAFLNDKQLSKEICNEINKMKISCFLIIK